MKEEEGRRVVEKGREDRKEEEREEREDEEVTELHILEEGLSLPFAHQEPVGRISSFGCFPRSYPLPPSPISSPLIYFFLHF